MGSLLDLLGSAWNSAVGFVLPVAGSVRGSRVVRWIVHLVILAAILIGLYFLGKVWQFERLIHASALVRAFWLPAVFLLLYGLVWLSWWLWCLLRTGEAGAEYPDIASAWEEACDTLHQAGIDLRNVPVFIILGQCEGREESLFGASLLSFKVRQAPRRPDAPLHLWATPEGVYITCPGASLLGRHAILMSGGDESGAPASGGRAPESDTLAVTNMPGGLVDNTPEIEAILGRARRERRLPTREENRQMRTLLRKSQSMQSLLRNPEQVARESERLAYFSRLLARDRTPYVPINGILVLLPLAATDTDQDTFDTGNACQRDLAILREQLGVHVPVFGMVCDLETAPGFREFLGLFPGKQRHQRIGQRAPLAPEFANAAGQTGNGFEARKAMFEGLAKWVCNQVVPRWVYKHFHTEGPGQQYTAELTHENDHLFLFMDDIRGRWRRLGMLLAKSFVAEDEDHPWFGGCYVAGTGTEPEQEQGFVAGVFRRLTEEEAKGIVSWTGQTLRQDAVAQSRATFIWLVAGGLLLLLLALLAYAIFGQGATQS
jgi:hypothetical protein